MWVTSRTPEKTLLSKDADQPIGKNDFLSSRWVTFISIQAFNFKIASRVLEAIGPHSVKEWLWSSGCQKKRNRADKLWAGADS